MFTSLIIITTNEVNTLFYNKYVNNRIVQSSGTSYDRRIIADRSSKAVSMNVIFDGSRPCHLYQALVGRIT